MISPKEIRKATKFVSAEVRKSSRGLMYQKYDTFLGMFGMSLKRDFKVLKAVDQQLRKDGLTVWCGKEKRRSVAEFLRGETITFRLKAVASVSRGMEDSGSQRIGYRNAGTVNVVQGDSGIDLYVHQREAIERLNTEVLQTNKNPFAGLLVLPTGGGKTLTAAYWLCQKFLAQDKKILWIAHRHELLEQAKATFHERLAFSDILGSRRSFDYRIISGIHDKPVNIRPTDDIIMSSKDSLTAGFQHLLTKWIKADNREIFLVVDEAHHATAKTYRRLIKALQDNVEHFRMIGLTATPFRTAKDEQGLLAKVFPDDVIYKVDLRTLITRGILSEPVFEEVSTGFDMTRVLTKEDLDNLKYFDIDSIGRSNGPDRFRCESRRNCTGHGRPDGI